MLIEDGRKFYFTVNFRSPVVVVFDGDRVKSLVTTIGFTSDFFEEFTSSPSSPRTGEVVRSSGSMGLRGNGTSLENFVITRQEAGQF